MFSKFFYLTSSFNRSYSNMLNSNIKIIPDIGNVMPYQDLMEILFANQVKEIPKLELINKEFLVSFDDNDELYFILNRFEDFLNFLTKRIDFEKENIIAFNFLDCLKKLDIDFEVNENQIKLAKVLGGFREYLVEKEDFHSKIILDLFWNDIFKGTISTFNEEPYMMVIKFRKPVGFPLVLNITEGEQLMDNCLSIDHENSFDKLFENWKNILKMEDSDDFVVNCLTEVTGSVDLANFIFTSHSNKQKYVIKVNNLNEIINFKNEKKKDEYLSRFKSMYQSMGIFQDDGSDNLMLNFEGFNKYLLNLEIDYLDSFEDKERINTLYYNVMDELVNSYKKLYLFFKKI